MVSITNETDKNAIAKSFAVKSGSRYVDETVSWPKQTPSDCLIQVADPDAAVRHKEQ